MVLAGGGVGGETGVGDEDGEDSISEIQWPALNPKLVMFQVYANLNSNPKP